MYANTIKSLTAVRDHVCLCNTAAVWLRNLEREKGGREEEGQTDGGRERVVEIDRKKRERL